MNEIYIVDGKRFEVAPHRKEEFLAKYPTAQLATEEPGKEYPVGLGAPAEENVAPEQPSMDLDSAKTSLDLQEEDKPIRYIEFKVNGKNQVLYEEDYMKFAGKGKYPATFDEYATLYKTTPKTFAPVSSMLSIKFLTILRATFPYLVTNRTSSAFLAIASESGNNPIGGLSIIMISLIFFNAL